MDRHLAAATAPPTGFAAAPLLLGRKAGRAAMKWRQLPQSGDVPLARSSHTVTAVGGKLYLWGGEHKPREPIDSQLHVYDMETGAWTRPEVRADALVHRRRPGHSRR